MGYGKHPESGPDPPLPLRQGGANRLAWLPLPFLGALMPVLYLIPGDIRLGGLSWIPLLNLVGTTAGGLFAAALAAVSYLDGGQPVTPTPGAGMLLFGSANLLGNLFLAEDQLNTAVTVANLGYGSAGLCSLAAATMQVRPSSTHSAGGRRSRLLAGYGAALLLSGGTAWISLSGVMPPFYVPGAGATGMWWGRRLMGKRRWS